MTKNKIRLTVLLMVILATLGCIHKVNSLPVTPMERFSTDWAVLGQFVNTAESGTEAAVTSGLLTADQAKPIIQWERQIAADRLKLTPLIAEGPNAITSSTGLNQFLNDIVTQAQALVTSGGVGVKNPKTQQAISADIQLFGSLAKGILADVQLVKGGS